MTVVACLELEPDEADIEHSFKLVIQNPDMEACGASKMMDFGPVAHPFPGTVPLFVYADTTVEFTGQGIYPVILLVDEQVAHVQSIEVFDRPAS